MKRVTMADRSFLVGDEAADLLLDYAALVARLGRADGVRLQAIGRDGNEGVVGFLLNSGSTLLIEPSGSTLAEPDNTAVIVVLRGRLAEYDPQAAFPDVRDGFDAA